MKQWPNLTMYSVPLVSTWTFAEQYRLLVDCGDGAAAHLGGRIHKIDTIALTHAHRDHIGGLLQFLNLRGGNGTLRVLYPSGSGSFLALAEFLSQFDRETSGKVSWFPMNIGESFLLQNNLHLEAFETNHMAPSAAPRSIGYRIIRSNQKLKNEFLGRGSEIPELVKQFGEEMIFNFSTSREIIFCGDGLPQDPKDVLDASCLILESTFLEDGKATKEHIHVHLDQAFELVNKSNAEKVIINHISSRYSEMEIMNRIEELLWPCPVKVVLPGNVLKLP